MAQEKAQNRCLYIVGAQGTGKTTLVDALENEFLRREAEAKGTKPHIIREVARTVLKEKQFSRDDITSSPSRAFQLQEYILDAQFDAEQSAMTSDSLPMWYISDRSGLDPIVYAQLFVGDEAAEKMLASEKWKVLEKRMKTAVVILCEAGCSWLADDGTRLMPDGIEQWMRIDVAFRALLSARGIGFTVITKDMISLEERVKLVQKQLEKLE